VPWPGRWLRGDRAGRARESDRDRESKGVTEGGGGYGCVGGGRVCGG